MNRVDFRINQEQYFIDTTEVDRTGSFLQLQSRNENCDCFATAYDGECDQFACMWRAGCFELSRP